MVYFIPKWVYSLAFVGAQNVFNGLLMVNLYVHVNEKTHAMRLEYVNFHRNQRKFRYYIIIILFVYCKLTQTFSRIQIGLWDGSIESGTAQWSRGPIDVSHNQ